MQLKKEFALCLKCSFALPQAVKSAEARSELVVLVEWNEVHCNCKIIRLMAIQCRSCLLSAKLFADFSKVQSTLWYNAIQIFTAFSIL